MRNASGRAPSSARFQPSASMPDPARIARPWLASYPPGVPPTYDYPRAGVGQFLDDAARRFPDRVAIRHAGRSTSYAELIDLVDRLAAALVDLGVRHPRALGNVSTARRGATPGAMPGPRIAMALDNVRAFPVVLFAAQRVGAVVVPLSRRMPISVLRAQLRDCGARVLVCHSTAATDVGDLTRVLPKLDHIIVVDRRHSVSSRGRWLAPLRRRRRPGREATGTHLLSLRDLIETHRPITRAAVVDGHDLAAIQYGPGGERGAVGVRRSHANLEASAFQSRLWLAETRAGRERVLAAAPFSQPYGLTAGLLAGVLSGATLVLVPRFDMDHIITAVNSHRPTLFPATEPMLTTFVESDTGVDFASLRVCLAAGIGGASGEVVRRFQTRFGTRTRRAYGPVAAASLTHANPVYGAAGKIGLPLPDTTAAVIDPARPEIPLEPGEPGELAVHGPQVMTGLWGSPSAVGHGAGPRVVDGWLLTGETAVMDQAGYFELTAGSLPGDGAAVRRIASPSGRRGGDDGS